VVRPARSVILCGAVIVLLAGCAPSPAPSASTASAPAGQAPVQNRVLVMVIRYEIEQLLPKMYQSSIQDEKRLFSASLVYTDDAGALRPMLAEVPQLNSDTWRVSPNGSMETTYRLRPDLVWQDGQPLTAGDFVFAWQVYRHPGLDVFTRSPQQFMDSVTAPDPRTLVIHWNSPFPDANNLDPGELDPLPRHVLEQPFAALQQDPTGADAFLGLPYWRAEYVGAGPYRLVRWEPGSHFEGVAFDRYVLGRPTIDRVMLRVIADDNTALTNLLAGSIDIVSLRFEHGQQLVREWVPTGKGVVRFNRGGAGSEWIQLRPEYVGNPALLDVRVRRAIVHAVDRQAINDGVFDGQGSMAESIVSESEPFFPDVDRAIVKYPYDPRRTAQLMNEAGLVKDRDGIFVNAAGQRLTLSHQTLAGPHFERMQLIQADTWQRAGIAAEPSILSNALVRAVGEHRHNFPGISTRGGGRIERNWITAEIGSAENRWGGENRSGWSNPEYDCLYEAFLTTLDRGERTRQFVQMQRLISEQLPTYFTHFAAGATMWVADLKGPSPTPLSAGTGTFTRGGSEAFHLWEWR
jgi:peptide/nickel transport system substrate-binding protein